MKSNIEKGKLHLHLVDILTWNWPLSILDKLFTNSESGRPEMSINLIDITENVLKPREDDYGEGS